MKVLIFQFLANVSDEHMKLSLCRNTFAAIYYWGHSEKMFLARYPFYSNCIPTPEDLREEPEYELSMLWSILNHSIPNHFYSSISWTKENCFEMFVSFSVVSPNAMLLEQSELFFSNTLIPRLEMLACHVIKINSLFYSNLPKTLINYVDCCTCFNN